METSRDYSRTSVCVSEGSFHARRCECVGHGAWRLGLGPGVRVPIINCDDQSSDKRSDERCLMMLAYPYCIYMFNFSASAAARSNLTQFGDELQYILQSDSEFQRRRQAKRRLRGRHDERRPRARERPHDWI